MKEKIILTIIAFSVFSVFAAPKKVVVYEMPKMEKSNAFYINSSEYTSNVKEIKFEFEVMNGNSFQLFMNDSNTQKWSEIARVNLRGFEDKQKKKVKAGKNVYFSLIPENDSKYSYKVSASTKGLLIKIRPYGDNFKNELFPKINLKNAIVTSIKSFEAEDYLIFHNCSAKDKITVLPYYYDKKSYKWIRGYEIAALKGFDDTAKIELIDDEEFDKIDYLAFEIEPEGEYQLKMSAKHNDLYIDIYEYSTNETPKERKMWDELNSVED